jgi:FSR family fosmidomycin resistance protein-like MFS transporter
MQVTSSLLQPMVGLFADHRPQPYSLAVGMGVTFVGLLLLASADSFLVLLPAAALVGTGSAVFHPEASRVARMASGGRHGLAQSLFQVGGNIGSAIGPILAALIVIPKGQSSIAWFSSAALLAMIVLVTVGNWYRREHPPARGRGHSPAMHAGLPRRTVGWSVVILMALVFSKSFYTASLGSYYTFYLISKFHVSIEAAQIYLFAFLAAVAVGTLIGGPIGDRIGRKAVIWGSIVGVIPFTLTLPYVDLFWTGILSVVIGLTLASASSAIIVCARSRARAGRHGVGNVFRPVLRTWRGRRGGAGRARRHEQHRHGLPGLRLPAVDRAVDGITAEPRPADAAGSRPRRRGVMPY